MGNPNKDAKTIDVKVERLINAPPAEVFEAWFDSKIPGTTWHLAEKFSLNPEVDGLFFWHFKGVSHYGRFTAIARPSRVEHTWMSPNTHGHESTVSVTFKKQGEDTLMTLVHSGLPDTEPARGHEKGWGYFLETFSQQFGSGSRKPYRFEEAHPEEGKRK